MTTAAEPTFVTKEQLAEKVQLLATLRADAAARAASNSLLIAAFNATHAETLAEERRLKAEAFRIEAELRVDGLEVYGATEGKHPCPGIDIDMTKSIVYDRQLAEAWSIEHDVARIPSKFDEDAFTKLVKSKALVVDFAKIEENPKVTIARDLEKALAAVAK